MSYVKFGNNRIACNVLSYSKSSKGVIYTVVSEGSWRAANVTYPGGESSLIHSSEIPIVYPLKGIDEIAFSMDLGNGYRLEGLKTTNSYNRAVPSFNLYYNGNSIGFTAMAGAQASDATHVAIMPYVWENNNTQLTVQLYAWAIYTNSYSLGQVLLGIESAFAPEKAHPNTFGTAPGLLFYMAVDVIGYESINTSPEDPPINPYEPGGPTVPGGGTGSFDETNDPVEIPSLPQLSASDTGLVTLFNPTLSQLKQLSSYLWSDLFDVTAWKKIFADPMDAILGLSIVPVAVPNVGTSPIKVGNITTDVSANRATTQFVEVNCGSIDVVEYWGAYLDYDPYTKVELYLPYIGVHPLTTDDVMGKTMQVVYHVDILSGACCAYVKCGPSVLYSFVGQCSSTIPITGSNWTNVINGAINIAASIGSMVATGGATAPMAVADIASTAVNSMKPTVEKSGSISGTGGLMGLQTPYLILTRPRQAVPENQNRYSGYPSFITRKLANLTGYTEIESIHLENVPATEQELSEIESLLKGGVML